MATSSSDVAGSLDRIMSEKTKLLFPDAKKGKLKRASSLPADLRATKEEPEDDDELDKKTTK